MQRLRNILRRIAQPSFGYSQAVLEKRHQPSGLNSAFNGEGLSFAEYVADTRDMLREAHNRLCAADVPRRVEGNAPFDLKPDCAGSAGKAKPYRRGVLLTHGLIDSPYYMRHLAALFQEQGFRVMAVLLPGHGTQPGDLLDMRWQEWADAVAYGTDRLAEECDEIYLGGLSTGGSLSIRHALCDSRVRGLFLFAPAIKITPLAAFANVHKLYSWLKPSARWVDILPDRDIYRYESFPKNAAAQVYALSKELGRMLKKNPLTIPVFCVASADDTTVCSSATLALMARTLHPANRLVLYTTAPENFRCKVPAENLELVNSMMPEQHILSSAHTAIVLPPDDARYGLNGEYSNCMHYYSGDKKSYAACMQSPDSILQGEITRHNLKAGLLRRLMYNPNFAALKDSMRRFIGNLP